MVAGSDFCCYACQVCSELIYYKDDQIAVCANKLEGHISKLLHKTTVNLDPGIVSVVVRVVTLSPIVIMMQILL